MINERIERSPKALVDAFRKHDTAKIADAMARGAVMHHEIKPIQRGMKVCGPAVTVWTRPGDVLFVLKASDVMQRGDVLVVDAGGYKDLAGTGERFTSYLKAIGAEGQVIDGGARDSQGISDLGFPTFARARCIAVFGANGPGAINVPVQCGGVVVHPGDLIVGDDDGVVVVPRQDAETILRLAEEHLKGELTRLEQVRAGKSIVEAQNLNPRVDAWRQS